MFYTAKIEQTYSYPKRMKYIAAEDKFIEKDCESLSFYRNVHQPYGWLMESGTPPCAHLDVIVMTDKEYRLGDEEPVRIVGVFKRNDGDHKLVGVLRDREVTDFSGLSDAEKEDMHRLYPYEAEGEGWFGKECAKQIIDEFFAKKKRKNIIMVQHTESQHHVNGKVGAWGNWELTERGKEQAFEIGRWLLKYECDPTFRMYVSDLTRAVQTAEGINQSLHLNPIEMKIIREVSAGAGNGTDRDWYNANKIPQPMYYDPDYKPFDDAESDRDLWNRLYPFYQEIIASEEEKILIVSHGTSLSFLQSMLMGYSLKDIKNNRFIGDAGSITKIIIEPNGKVIACYVNHRI